MINRVSVIQENRHNSHDGRWYGPDKEPNKPSPDCICAGCKTRYHGTL